MCVDIVLGSVDERMKILTEGAKYDVSCSSSNSARGAQQGSVGQCNIAGVCHSFTSDGRCISLLKLLLTNKCEYNCAYCINRRDNNIPRASLTPREVCEIVVGFYRRNYIEGLFLSSAVEISPDYTMQKLVETLTLLRGEYKFRAYVHVKAIPGASPELIEQAARLADRMSANIELPSEKSLKLLAPAKTKQTIITPMKQLDRLTRREPEARRGERVILPAGQTTQMIIGASPDSDGQIVRLSEGLYTSLGLKRVYYSAYTPVNESSLLPVAPPDLRHENRLYQADWLLRFYGFGAHEILGENDNLPLDIDPKSFWALNNIGHFPVEVNTASYEMLLRVPGIGVRNAYRIVHARKSICLTLESLKRMRIALTRALYFITIGGKYYGIGDKPELIRLKLNGQDKLNYTLTEPKQISIFDNNREVAIGEF